MSRVVDRQDSGCWYNSGRGGGLVSSQNENCWHHDVRTPHSCSSLGSDTACDGMENGNEEQAPYCALAQGIAS